MNGTNFDLFRVEEFVESKEEYTYDLIFSLTLYEVLIYINSTQYSSFMILSK